MYDTPPYNFSPTLLPNNFHTLSDETKTLYMFEEETGDQFFNTVKLFFHKQYSRTNGIFQGKMESSAAFLKFNFHKEKMKTYHIQQPRNYQRTHHISWLHCNMKWHH